MGTALLTLIVNPATLLYVHTPISLKKINLPFPLFFPAGY